VDDRHDDRIKIEALLRQDVLVSLGRFLIGNPAQDAEPDELLEPLGEQMPRDSERRLKHFEPPLAQEALSQNQQAPAVADHGNRAGQ
jgi:hypothetical protein